MIEIYNHETGEKIGKALRFTIQTVENNRLFMGMGGIVERMPQIKITIGEASIDSQSEDILRMRLDIKISPDMFEAKECLVTSYSKDEGEYNYRDIELIPMYIVSNGAQVKTEDSKKIKEWLLRWRRK